MVILPSPQEHLFQFYILVRGKDMLSAPGALYLAGTPLRYMRMAKKEGFL